MRFFLPLRLISRGEVGSEFRFQLTEPYQIGYQTTKVQLRLRPYSVVVKEKEGKINFSIAFLAFSYQETCGPETSNIPPRNTLEQNRLCKKLTQFSAKFFVKMNTYWKIVSFFLYSSLYFTFTKNKISTQHFQQLNRA